jgi:hypothetical protein
MGLAAFSVGELSSSQCGFIDKHGKIVIKPQFDDAHDFSDGLASIRIRDRKPFGKWGYIDKQGKIVIKPLFYKDVGRNIFYQSNRFFEGLAEGCIEENSKFKCGFVKK